MQLSPEQIERNATRGLMTAHREWEQDRSPFNDGPRIAQQRAYRAVMEHVAHQLHKTP